MGKLEQPLVALLLLLALLYSPAGLAHGRDAQPAVRSAQLDAVSVAPAGYSLAIGVTACGDESCPCGGCGSCDTQACSLCAPGVPGAMPMGMRDRSPSRWGLFSPPLHLEFFPPIPTRPPLALA